MGVVIDFGDSSPGGSTASIRAQGALLQFSRNAQAFQSFSAPMFNVLDYGAVADGIADDTSALQHLFDQLTETGQGAKCATIHFPGFSDSNIGTRRYRITKPVVYQGNPSCALRIMGELAARGDSGTQITWDGPHPVVASAGGVVRADGTVRVTVSHSFQVGDHVVSGHTEGTFYGGLKIVTDVGSGWFEYSETGPDGETSAQAHTYGQSMFEFLGLNSSVIENIQFHGRGKALYNIWIRQTSASIFFDRVTNAAAANSAYSACWAIGDPQDALGTHQTSEVFFDRCEAGGAGVGAVIAFLSAGNTKNFHIKDSIFSTCRVAVRHPGEGVITIIGGIALNVSDTVVQLGSSRAVLMGVEVEAQAFSAWKPGTGYSVNQIVKNGGNAYLCTQAGSSAVLDDGPSGTGFSITDNTVVWIHLGLDGSRFVTGGVSSNMTSVELYGCSWNGEAPSVDDVVVNVGAPLKLVGNEFYNNREAGTSLPWIIANGATWTPNATAGHGAAAAAIDSFGNFFAYASDVAPFSDGSNLMQASLHPSAGYARLVPHSVRSRADVGGGNGTLNKLREFDGYPPSYVTLVVPQASISGATPQEIGQPASGWHRVTIDNIVWNAHAPSQSISVFLPPARFRICAVYADVKEAFDGVTGPLEIRIGSQPYPAANDHGYLLSFGVGSRTQRGADTSHLGVHLTGTGFAQGGYLPHWVNSHTIYVSLVSASDNLGNGSATNLKHGIVDIILKAERVPGMDG